MVANRKGASLSGIARGILGVVTIPAKFEGGVFRPLESVAIEEGTLVEVHVPVEAEERPRKRRSIKDLPFFGMWADRDDIADGVSYVDQLRDHPRG
jgi:predicted DNA-binding antitoxin AbrB/MazE fold protein